MESFIGGSCIFLSGSDVLSVVDGCGEVALIAEMVRVGLVDGGCGESVGVVERSRFGGRGRRSRRGADGRSWSTVEVSEPGSRRLETARIGVEDGACGRGRTRARSAASESEVSSRVRYIASCRACDDAGGAPGRAGGPARRDAEDGADGLLDRARRWGASRWSGSRGRGRWRRATPSARRTSAGVTRLAEHRGERRRPGSSRPRAGGRCRPPGWRSRGARRRRAAPRGPPVAIRHSRARPGPQVGRPELDAQAPVEAVAQALREPARAPRAGGRSRGRSACPPREAR